METNTAPSEFQSALRVMPTASGHTMLLSAEEFPLYHLHVTRFFTDWRPQNQTESVLVQRIADNEWRVDRIARLEMGIYALGQREFAAFYPEEDPNVRMLLIETQTHNAYRKQLNSLGIQESRLRRYVATDSAELRRLQAERVEREDEKKATAAVASHAPSITPKTSVAATGFEFSDASPRQPQASKSTPADWPLLSPDASKQKN